MLSNAGDTHLHSCLPILQATYYEAVTSEDTIPSQRCTRLIMPWPPASQPPHEETHLRAHQGKDIVLVGSEVMQTAGRMTVHIGLMQTAGRMPVHVGVFRAYAKSRHDSAC